MRRTRAGSLAAAAISATLIALTVGAAPGTGAVATDQLTFTVDPTVRPGVAEVGPVDGSRTSRQVGAVATPVGTTAELVLDELIVHVRDQAELDGFLARWNGQVLDSFAPDADGQDHLVKADVSGADPAGLAADLLATEPRQSGRYRASDERVLRLLALAASEWKLGTEVVVNWLTEPATIESGEAFEASDISKNVFDWSFMRAGGAMDTGVAAAWQVLQAKGKLTPSVRYMVVDGGFSPNIDFPANSKIRKASWGQTNPSLCTNGTPCPYHGTDVVLAGMAEVDNNYGTAGPAGPVVSQLIAVGNNLDYWSVLRRTENMAEEEDPDVVNLSFTRDVNLGSAHAKKWTDRRMRHVRDTGALIVAAAGNNGLSVDTNTLWVPCESAYVMCVGGMRSDATVSPGSNFGQGDTPTSVEIYGPMCVRTINDPNKSMIDYSTKPVCGTSAASPFVGGVAALVMAADPTLGPEAVRAILNETAHVGGLGAKVTGSQRRVNALAAVTRALDIELTDPKVSIQKPVNGKVIGHTDWVDLTGTATDFLGRTVKITWWSDRDGKLGEGSATSVPPLSVGAHTITASATDSTGRTGTASVDVTVVDSPPVVKMVSPVNGAEIVEGNSIALVATSLDPDTNGPVPDSDTSWQVRRNGALVHTASGHSATLPPTKVTPGSYTVRFTAAGVSVQRSFTVTAIPAGQHKPVATIVTPATNLSLSAYNGTPRTISFAGNGQDAEDGAVAGTRYRWTAHSGGQSKVLCTGSNVPTGEPPGGIVIYKNCASFTAQLGLAPGDYATTTWTVVLEVFDASGLVGIDSVNVEIYYVTG